MSMTSEGLSLTKTPPENTPAATPPEMLCSLGRVLAAGDAVHCYAAKHYNKRGVVERFAPHGRVLVRVPSGSLLEIHHVDLERV